MFQQPCLYGLLFHIPPHFIGPTIPLYVLSYLPSYIPLYIHVYIYIYTYKHTSIHTLCAYVYMYVYIYIYVCVCVIYIYIYTYMYTHGCVYILSHHCWRNPPIFCPGHRRRGPRDIGLAASCGGHAERVEIMRPGDGRGSTVIFSGSR